MRPPKDCIETAIMPWLIRARKEAARLGLALIRINDPVAEFTMLCQRIRQARPPIDRELYVALHGQPVFELEMEHIDAEWNRAWKELDEKCADAEAILNCKVKDDEVPF